MKKMLMVLVVVVMSLSFTARASIVDELKEWDFSLGGATYLVEADTVFYSAGTSRDLGGVFNWMPKERLSFELGFLRAGDEKQYGYTGISINGNFVVQSALDGLNRLLDANFGMPPFLENVLAHTGLVGAKSMDNFFDFSEGYDWGVNLTIIGGSK